MVCFNPAFRLDSANASNQIKLHLNNGLTTEKLQIDAYINALMLA